MGDASSVARFLFEVGALKNIPRSGWLYAGIKNPESVSEHTMRSALIGWILAEAEKADRGKVIKMLLLHDLAEARTSDTNLVTKRYLDISTAERKAFRDMFENLPKGIKEEATKLVSELLEQKTREAVVANDADKLEMFIQAHEYEKSGHGKEIMREFKDSARGRIRTRSARELLKRIEKTGPGEWWRFAHRHEGKFD